ncbi:hypothetical protein [Bacteroides acidifaciens]|jgi:hypothetical protein|uniref:hypothetical protein n=1 Tax=Bacteroides acidifaciens TaxID=85831 RepID=UPI003F67B9F2
MYPGNSFQAEKDGFIGNNNSETTDEKEKKSSMFFNISPHVNFVEVKEVKPILYIEISYLRLHFVSDLTFCFCIVEKQGGC